MLNLRGDVRPAATSLVLNCRSHHLQRNYLRLTLAPTLLGRPPPHHEIISVPCRRRSSAARVVGRLVPEITSLGNVKRKEREARIRKQLHQFTVSPSAYDTAWVSMVPLPGSPQAPLFPQCIDWLLGNQKDDGSWGIENNGSAVSKDILLSTLASVIALKKWNIGEEHITRGLRFIGQNFSIVLDDQIAAPLDFSLIFHGMLRVAIAMGLEFPAFQRTDIDKILHVWEEELERLYMENSYGTKAYIAYVSEGLGNLVDWSEVIKFQRKNGSLFNSLSTTAALLIQRSDDKALQFLRSVVSKFGSAVPAVYPVNMQYRLSIVDSLEKLGIYQYFSSEIKSILDMTYSLWIQRDDEIMLDFTTCSIAFRHLRMNGYDVSSDELSHLAEVSSFNSSVEGYLDYTKSLMEIYKASQIDYALKFPFYTTLERLDHKRNIENFDATYSQLLKTEYMTFDVNEDLMSLAIEDFAHSQSIYQEELINIQSWVKQNRLDQLHFARQRVTYCYLCAAGSIINHELFDARISIAKNAILASVVDDFFDGGGSQEKLKELIALVEMWDEPYTGKLYSEGVKIVYSALYTTLKDLGSRVNAVQNIDVTEQLVETWLHVLRAMMTEAEWRVNQYVPTLEEYKKMAGVSISAGPVVFPTLYFVGKKLSKWIAKNQEYNELLQLTGTCTRLLNDIQGLERDEGSEAKLNSVSLLLHHYGGAMSIEMAKMEIRKSIITTRKDLLRLVLKEESIIPRPCKEVFWKICKLPHFFYFETDGYSSPKKMASAVNALIYEPLKLAS
uniref:Uncharacterized protein n=1 Tax=Avena sativa TaxID=4498 RepID=A0ACD5VBT8_AVESA